MTWMKIFIITHELKRFHMGFLYKNSLSLQVHSKNQNQITSQSNSSGRLRPVWSDSPKVFLTYHFYQKGRAVWLCRHPHNPKISIMSNITYVKLNCINCGLLLLCADMRNGREKEYLVFSQISCQGKYEIREQSGYFSSAGFLLLVHYS